jgi:predicted alpha/beta hydrolase family esterase
MKKKNNVILLHGRFSERIEGKLIADIPLCDPNNEGNWMGWTKKRLEENGYVVTCPIVANVWKARYEEWAAVLDRLTIDEETILVGLSAGGYALLRWLSETGTRVKKAILVAPGSRSLAHDPNRVKMPHEEEFYAHEITPRLKMQIKDRVVIIVSTDDEVIGQTYEGYVPLLDANVIRLEHRGHFSFLIPELPELLAEIQKEGGK